MFDRRPYFDTETHPSGLDEVGRAILAHLTAEAVKKVFQLVPGTSDAIADLRSELLVAVLDHITLREGPWSYRKYFLSSIYFEKSKILDDRKKEAVRFRSLDASLEDGRDSVVTDAIEQIANQEAKLLQRRRAVAEFLAGIADPDEREALRRFGRGEGFAEIGRAMRRDRGTVTRWIRRYVPEEGGDNDGPRVGDGR